MTTLTRIGRAASVGMLLALTACVPAYMLVAPGTVNVEGLQVSPGQSWNLAPAAVSASMRKNAQVWTQDGLLLDRLIIIPACPMAKPL